MKAVSTYFMFSIAVLAATGAWAGAGLLANPTFNDADQLDGWTIFTNSIADWDPQDEEGLAASGSATLTHQGVGNNGIRSILFQCLPMQGYEAYSFGASILMPSGQNPDHGRGRVFVAAYSTTDCTGSADNFFTPPLDAVIDEWQFTESTFVTPPATLSIRLVLGVQKFTGVSEDLSVKVDNVFLLSDQLFGDSFESG